MVIESRQFPVALLGNTSSSIHEKVDAEEFVGMLHRQIPDWVILDHYELGWEWESIVKSVTKRLLVIDDLPNRKHQCDVFLDQNFLGTSTDWFHERTSMSTHLLLGPRFALLDPKFSKTRNETREKRGDIFRVCVFGGGSDQKNLVGKTLSALQGTPTPLQVDVVLGRNSQPNDVETSLNPNHVITFHNPGDHFLELLAKSDFAIGAGGVTNWERLCLGLPSIVISVADNQLEVCKSLSDSGLIKYLGPIEEVDEPAITKATNDIVAGLGKMRDAMERAKILIDGYGSSRVAEVMCPSAESDIVIRPATLEHLYDYYSWVIDPLVRRQSLDNRAVTLTGHVQWFNDRIKSASSKLYVVVVHDLPVGQVRFECNDRFATISYSLDSLVRGRGWATGILEAAIKLFRMHCELPLRAVVKAENATSRKVFLNLGFGLFASEPDNEIVEFRNPIDQAGITR
jgi:UDP-2,4-diacetamido-2,4,6-trideoxy-beta-L-altropyranose hydrolase